MQLRLAPSPYYRLPQRLEAVEDVSARAQPADDEHSRQQANQSPPANESTRNLSSTAADNARREYYYSRVEMVAGRTAQALKNYTEVEDGTGREQLQAQLGLDIYA